MSRDNAAAKGADGGRIVVEVAAGPSVDVRFRRPQGPLGTLITAYYFVEINGAPGAEIEDMLHPEWGNLRFLAGEDWDVATGGGQYVRGLTAALFGPTSRARPIRARPGTVIGIGFTPQGWAQLIRVDAGKLAEEVVPADEVLAGVGSPGASLRAASDDDLRVVLLDAYFGRLARIGRPCDPRIGVIAAALEESVDRTVEELALLVDMDAAQLARRCRRWFGFPAKTLLRRQRFLRTFARLLEPGGQGIGRIIDESYYDQSHFNREFRHFMGMSPRVYFSRPRPILRPAAARRAAEVGQALQGLHRSADGWTGR